MNRTGELGYQIGLDYLRLSVGLGVHVLINGALGRIECSLLDGGLKFVLGGLHQRRVESATNKSQNR